MCSQERCTSSYYSKQEQCDYQQDHDAGTICCICPQALRELLT